MATTKMPGKSKRGEPMKLLPTSTVAAVTKAIAAMRNMAGWKSTGIRSFSAIPRQIQRVFGRLPANRRPDDNAPMATRRPPNGQAPEPPLRVESREELVYLLGEACELEHGLLCEYLYAQFSLKRSVAEGVTSEQLARIKAWETTLIDVVKQEMLHLALATNILTAIGAAPHFERPNFPILSRWYPPDVQIALVPFGERALRHFMYLERPEGMALEDAEGFAALGKMDPLRNDDPQLTAGPEEWHTVGHLYRGIEAGLAHLVNSHFGKFVGILEDYLAERAADPSFEPARPVMPVYLREPPDVEAVTLIEDPLTQRVADLFNAVYEVVLQSQSRYFVHQGETPQELETLAKTVKHLMNWVMRSLGPVLTSLPVGPQFPGRTAGPAFEIVRPAFFVLPHREAAWKILRERLATLSGVAAELADAPGLGALKALSGNLDSFARDLGGHLDTRAAQASAIVTLT